MTAKNTPAVVVPENATVIATVDPLLAMAIERATDAVTYARSFDGVVTQHSTLVAALAVLDGTGHSETVDGSESDVANTLRAILGTLDREAATDARNKALAGIDMVKRTATMLGVECPELPKIGNVASDGMKVEGPSRYKGYDYSVTNTEGVTSTFDTIEALAKALDGKATDYRDARGEATGDERPETFTFTADGIDVTATKRAAK